MQSACFRPSTPSFVYPWSILLGFPSYFHREGKKEEEETDQWEDKEEKARGNVQPSSCKRKSRTVHSVMISSSLSAASAGRPGAFFVGLCAEGIRPSPIPDLQRKAHEHL